jgi:hypothetical protein
MKFNNIVITAVAALVMGCGGGSEEPISDSAEYADGHCNIGTIVEYEAGVMCRVYDINTTIERGEDEDDD